MLWRVVVRISLTADQGSNVRNNIIKPLFEACGINRSKTGTWESEAAEPECAATTLSQLMQELSGLAAHYDGATPILNHLWIYIDRVSEVEIPGEEIAV